MKLVVRNAGLEKKAVVEVRTVCGLDLVKSERIYQASNDCGVSHLLFNNIPSEQWCQVLAESLRQKKRRQVCWRLLQLISCFAQINNGENTGVFQ